MQSSGTKKEDSRDNCSFCAGTAKYKNAYYKKLKFKTLSKKITD